jgi:hypothetical protein
MHNGLIPFVRRPRPAAMGGGSDPLRGIVQSKSVDNLWIKKKSVWRKRDKKKALRRRASVGGLWGGTRYWRSLVMQICPVTLGARVTERTRNSNEVPAGAKNGTMGGVLTAWVAAAET